MKRKTTYKINNKTIEKEISYIPIRYIISILIALLETLTMIGIVFTLCYFVPYFFILVLLTQLTCVFVIIASDDNPDYKIPWLLFIILVPIVGFMCYFIFYSRKLDKKFVKKLSYLENSTYHKDDEKEFSELKYKNIYAYNQAKSLVNFSKSHLFSNTSAKYFKLGEDMFESMINDLKNAESFIFLEYFIIEQGVFWNTILDILKTKVNQGIEVKIVYDDIGCMNTLPGNYYKILKSYGISAYPFSRLRGQANNEFNNRSHRKIMIIDGKVGYTGGINIADEYINQKQKHGHWKDVGLRVEGEAVLELTRLFLIDYGMNSKNENICPEKYYCYDNETEKDGYFIPFGDGPKPIFDKHIAKNTIFNLLSGATKNVSITTPYFIVDNELCSAIENAAFRGVDVRIVVPHIPDKKIVFAMTKSFYPRLINAGVKIYEYTPGFIHAKSIVVDDEYALIGTINFDYRSLIHHFENGIWIYKSNVIKEIKSDIENTVKISKEITKHDLKSKWHQKLITTFVKIFAPLL